jgi:hypothetical protein
LNVNEYLCPWFNFPEANALAGRVPVAVCGARSLFTHVTVVPGVTVKWDGLKANPLMVTVAVLLCAPAIGAKSSRATSDRAANRSSIFLNWVLSSLALASAFLFLCLEKTPAPFRGP